MYYVKVFFKFICEDKCLLQISLKIALNISIYPVWDLITVLVMSIGNEKSHGS